MVSIPGMMPVTKPPVVMVALPLLALHAPPGLALVRSINEPTHTENGPAIGLMPEADTTVTACVATNVPQLLVTEYMIVSTPAVIPVTIPVLPTVAIEGLLLLHTPPVAVLESAIVLPTHRLDGPVMAPALAPMATATEAVAVILPQALAIV
jgi:hypothetical protein